jgi:hypothetical protein
MFAGVKAFAEPKPRAVNAIVIDNYELVVLGVVQYVRARAACVSELNEWATV